MGSLQTITFLQGARECLRHPDRGPPEQRLFTFEKPHTCTQCETVQLDLQVKKQVFIFICWDCQHKGVGKVTDSGEYICSNCGRPFGASGGDDLWYTATLDHNIPQAVDAAQSGCQLYRWVTAKTARYMPAVAEKWETQEVMDAIAAHCRFEVSGLSSMGPGQDGRCVLSFRLVCPGAVSEDLREFSMFLGELPAWAAAGDPASKYILSRPYGLDVTSQESMRFAKDCFSVCMDRHNWCRTDQIGHLALDREAEEIIPGEKVNLGDVPTRLIDVGTSDSPRLRLVETADDDGALRRDVSEAGFMALSYCWGGNQQAKLLEAKVADYKRSIDPARLSQTLQEAVWVARTTGFRYLWIDSLCIHQDDVDGQGNNPDKAMEMARMASYYGRATITLCAASSEKAVDGFLGVRKDASLALGPVRIQLRSKDAGQPIGRVYLVGESDPPPTEPTTTRGWTLQESLLSRRILIFGRRQVYWSCLNSFGGCGGSIIALTNRTIPGVQSLVDGIYPAGSLIDQPTWAQWGVIVKDYTKRQLGRGGDKLWAVAALAQHMASMSKTRGEDPAYAAGLLVDQAEPGTWLPQLLWHPVTPGARRPSTDRAPSWSWASVDGPVVVPSWRSRLTEYAAVKDWEVDLLEPTAPYGALSGGRMTLVAKVQPMNRAQAASAISWGDWGDGTQFDDFYDSGPWGKEEGSENGWALILLADCPEDRKTIEADLKSNEPESPNPLLVAILPLTTGKLVGVQGLLVRPDAGGSSGGSYKKLGGFQLRAGSQTGGRPESSVFKFFEGAETKTLRMV
ncbi:heterokaryon incompatibility protein-domain-containing protein [Lasiosphaeria hispida]|uniref:Heterokaryon incompatibility protein-domain-containing protein n=1 Tax=Lasiosphaeria hispida TaxID=260671 RepID=A0AAJ0MDS9_9PEZI|nr:heterokaryon incompatibility protein-domain-containing protein [Lasiosphaeria hispida]